GTTKANRSNRRPRKKNGRPANGGAIGWPNPCPPAKRPPAKPWPPAPPNRIAKPCARAPAERIASERARISASRVIHTPLFDEGRPVPEIGPAAEMLVCIAASWSVCGDRPAAEDPIDDDQDGEHHRPEGPRGLPRPRCGRPRRRTARSLGRVLRS